MESNDRISRNLAALKELFPNCVTESEDPDGNITLAVDPDMLRQMLSEEIVPGRESYAFTWVGKNASIAEAMRPVHKVFRPSPKESRDYETSENLYIKGDNLDALKLLLQSLEGAVKMIYIDPPYNTGHEFVYPDSFRHHSEWCSMIYPRLLLARDLLTRDGIILINMDENEISNLQKICEEIFGEENDLGTIVWDKRNPKGDASGISCQHEYIVLYAKDRQVFTKHCRMIRPKKHAEAILKKAAQLFARVGGSYSLEVANRDFSAWMRAQKDFSGGERAYCKIDENGDVYRPVSMAWPNKKRAPKEYFVPLIHPETKKPCPVPERGWRNPPATMKRMAEEGRILFGKDETTIPNSKYLLKENLYENIPSLLYYGGSDTDLLSGMGIPFDTPKVVDICKEHIKVFTGGDDIVLDFFSGSATTAHAVMLANAEDGAKRRFIMVQVPERVPEKSAAFRKGYTDLSQIGMERIRRAGDKIRKETGEDIDCGFKVLVIDDP